MTSGAAPVSFGQIVFVQELFVAPHRYCGGDGDGGGNDDAGDSGGGGSSNSSGTGSSSVRVQGTLVSFDGERAIAVIRDRGGVVSDVTAAAPSSSSSSASSSSSSSSSASSSSGGSSRDRYELVVDTSLLARFPFAIGSRFQFIGECAMMTPAETKAATAAAADDDDDDDDEDSDDHPDDDDADGSGGGGRKRSLRRDRSGHEREQPQQSRRQQQRKRQRRGQHTDSARHHIHMCACRVRARVCRRVDGQDDVLFRGAVRVKREFEREFAATTL